MVEYACICCCIGIASIGATAALSDSIGENGSMGQAICRVQRLTEPDHECAVVPPASSGGRDFSLLTLEEAQAALEADPGAFVKRGVALVRADANELPHLEKARPDESPEAFIERLLDEGKQLVSFDHPHAQVAIALARELARQRDDRADSTLVSHVPTSLELNAQREPGSDSPSRTTDQTSNRPPWLTDGVKIGTVKTEGGTRYVKTWNGWVEIQNLGDDCYAGADRECRPVDELQELVRSGAEPAFEVLTADGEWRSFESWEALEQWKEDNLGEAAKADIVQFNPDGTKQHLQSSWSQVVDREGTTDTGDTQVDRVGSTETGVDGPLEASAPAASTFSEQERLDAYVRENYSLNDGDVLLVKPLGGEWPTTVEGATVDCTAALSSIICTDNDKVAKNIAKSAGAIDVGDLELRHDSAPAIQMVGSRAPLDLNVPGFDIGGSQTTSNAGGIGVSDGSSAFGSSFGNAPLDFRLDEPLPHQAVTWEEAAKQFKAHLNDVSQRLPQHLQPEAMKRSYQQFMEQLPPNARLALEVAKVVGFDELREHTSPFLESAIDGLPEKMGDELLRAARRAGLMEKERNFRIAKPIDGGKFEIEIERGGNRLGGLLPGLPTGGFMIRLEKSF